MEVKGSGRGLNKGTILAFSWGLRKATKIIVSRYEFDGLNPGPP
jgi:hypothetical protein